MTPTDHLYWYRARTVRVIDGDTVVLELDHGGFFKREWHVRLLGLNAPEIKGVEREAGLRTKEALYYMLENTMQDRNELVVRTQLDATDKYGRLLGELYVRNEEEWLNVNAWLIEQGLTTAQEY